MAEEGVDVFAYRVLLLNGLRSFGANYTEFTRRFAIWMGLNSSDAAALVEILYAEDMGTPLSPARLSERISLTSGATTALINRLEGAGHIVRTREHADRRIVTLRSSPKIHDPAISFFTPLGDHLDVMLAEYSEEQLKQFDVFLKRLQVAMVGALAEPDPPRLDVVESHQSDS